MNTLMFFMISIYMLLFGLFVLKLGLKSSNTLNIKKIILKFTYKPLYACLTGIFITGLLQSSSLVTILLIGLIDSELITFNQALGIILGANIGTTITGQIMALNIESFAIYFLILGIILLLIKKRSFSMLLFGIGFIFLGMDFLSKTFLYIRSNPYFKEFLILSSQNLHFSVFVGTICTAIIQSSSAFIGIIIALAKNGQIDLITAIGYILGSNIGTCLTAIIASLTSSKDSKRLALSHVFINILGVVIIYPFITYFTFLVTTTSSYLTRQIANAQTIFNIANSLIVLLIIDKFKSFMYKLIPK